MATYIALLRGINVGGNILKMERLREIWTELGFTKVRTYVQSGNVVFEASTPASAWAERLEPRLAQESRLPVSVIVRSRAELQRGIARNPFLAEPGIDLTKLHVTFLSAAPAGVGPSKFATIQAGKDRFHLAGREVYLYCPDGYGQTKLSNNALEKALAVRATTRNWNTVNKLAELAAE